jgi:hypothetical protein
MPDHAPGGRVGERNLSWEERIRYGTCPVCEAPDGEPCRADVGLQLGVRVDGRRMRDGEGVHLARIQKSPLRVKEVPRG